MDTLLCKRIGGRFFVVEVVDTTYVCDLANGAMGYEAEVTFCRDGERVGAGRWEPEGFIDCSGFEAEADESGIYDALASEVRAYLARQPAGAGGLALAL